MYSPMQERRAARLHRSRDAARSASAHHLRRPARDQRAQQQRPAQRPGDVGGVLPVGARDVHVAAQPADEVRLLGGALGALVSVEMKSSKRATVPPAKTKIAPPRGWKPAPSRKRPSSMGARKCWSQPNGTPSRGRRTRPRRPAAGRPRGRRRAPRGRQPQVAAERSCERLNSRVGAGRKAAPWPAAERRRSCPPREGRTRRRAGADRHGPPCSLCWMYSSRMLRTLLRLWISILSTEAHSPTVSTGMPAGRLAMPCTAAAAATVRERLLGVGLGEDRGARGGR